MIKGVIFDMDGVMFDTERLGDLGWTYLIEKYNLDFTLDLINKMRGLNHLDCKRMFEESISKKMTFEHADDIATAYLKGYVHAKGTPVKKGLFELLDYLKENDYKLAIATSSSKQKAYDYIKNSGAIDYFDGVIYGDMIELGKPNPDIFLKAAEVLELKSDECLVLEDSENGIKAAIRANCNIIYVKDVCPVKEEVLEKTLKRCNDLTEVIDYLDSNNKRKN